MKKSVPANMDCAAVSSDLERRLARYRTRVEAEGRVRSLELIDRAIRDAKRAGEG